jgi:outer membrane immunogenic protein
MQKTLLATTVAALIGAAGAAYAADMGPASMKDVPSVPTVTWAGFYLGAHVGGAWADLQNTDSNGVWAPLDYPGYKWTDSASGIIGGGQAGFNWLVPGNPAFGPGYLVFGLETDFGGIGLSHNTRPFGSPYLSSSEDSGFYADATVRAGYAVGSVLFYGKAGWAYYDSNLSLRDTGTVLCPGSVCSISRSGLNGWTVGGGVEYMITPSWGVKAEYRYFDFGDLNQNLYPNLTSGFDRHLTADAVTVGVNYYFGKAYQPLK